MPALKELPMISWAERCPLVEQLLAQFKYLLKENRWQAEWIQRMRDEIVVIKERK